MDLIQILGLLAGACTTIAFIPQVLKTYKTKSAKDISMGMFLLFSTGLILWLIYGIIKQDVPIIVANVLTLVSAFILILLKFKYKNT